MKIRLALLMGLGLIFAAGCGEPATAPVVPVPELDNFAPLQVNLPSHLAGALETVAVDSRLYGNPGGHALSTTTLQAGVQYRITVEGNWSAWPPSWWTCTSPFPVIFPSPSVPAGTQAGMDAEWRYADPSNCARADTPYGGIFFSLQAGAAGTFFDPVPIDGAFNANSRYEYLVTGTGQQAAFKHGDTNADNHGVMMVSLEMVVVDTDGDGVPDNQDPEPNRTNLYSWVNWTSANVAAGTASGTATLANGTTVSVNLRVADPNGPAPIFGYKVNGVNVGGISGFSFGDWFSNSFAPYTSAFVLNGPGFDDDIIALDGGAASGYPLSSYTITFSPAVSDPVMAIMSLGAGGNQAVYDFDRSFEILSQGNGRFGGGSASLTTAAGEQLIGREGNGTIRFLGSFSTFSWTVPDGEVWHGFTIGVRGLADPNADTDGDGVPDASDNCPAISNSGQADTDGDGIGDACDSIDDGNQDTDGDGLTNAEEVIIGTSPTNPDTDGDGVNDGQDGFPLDPNTNHTDSTPPEVSYALTGDLGNNGWYTGDVTITWTVVDNESAATSTGCETVTTSADGTGYTFTCSATSLGGTASVTSDPFMIDQTAPAVTGALSGTLGNNGWYVGAVTVAWTATDDGSGVVANCADETQGADGTGYNFSCTVEDNAGNTASATTDTFMIDQTAPTVSGTISGTMGLNGWYVSPVTATWTSADGGSGLVANCADETQSVDGTGYSMSCTVEDNAGNTASATTETFKIDQTAPDIIAALLAVDVKHNKGLFEVQFACSDNLDANPNVTSATINGVAVTNGQIVDLRLKSEKSNKSNKSAKSKKSNKSNKSGKPVKIEGTSFELTVDCMDEAGNTSTGSATPVFAAKSEKSEKSKKSDKSMKSDKSDKSDKSKKRKRRRR